MTRTKIWVISLADAGARRAQMAQSLCDSELDWVFFDAHRALQGGLSYRSEDSHATHGRTLRAGELGCYSSHYATWQQLLAADCDQAIILEDDVSADWSLIAQLAQINFAALGIHYLRLFAKIPPRWRYVASPFFDRYHHLIRCTSYALGTQAYVLTKEGAKIFTSAGQSIRYPIDALLDRYWDHGVPNLALFPFPVFERFQPSSIGSARFDPEVTSNAARAQYLTQRALVKLRMASEQFGPERAAVRTLKANLRGHFHDEPPLAADAR